MGTILDIFGILKIFDFFENFRQLDPPRNTGQKKTFSKKSPQNIFKIRLDTFGNDCGHFWNFESFLIFLKVFEDSTFMEHWAKKFSKKINPKHVQNMFGHFWERFRAFLRFLKIFDLFENFRRLDPPWNTGQKYFFEKITQNMSKTRLKTFGNDFRLCCNFEKFLTFLKIFEDSTLQGTLSKRKFFEKIAPKHVQNTFGHFWGRFRAFLKFLKIFDLFENFRRLDPPWNTGQKFFFEKITQNMSKTHLKTFGNDFRLCCNFEKFSIFLKIFEDSTFMEHWAKNFFKKINPKHVQNMFGHFWERFRAFLHFLKIFDLFENCRRLDLHGTLGKKFFLKN